MAGQILASRVVLFIVFIGCTIYSFIGGTERVRQVALRDRVLTYYARHAPDNTPNDKKMEKLLAKYGAGEEHLLEAALETKYGVGTLPPANYRALFAKDAVGTSFYFVRTTCSVVTNVLPGMPPLSGDIGAWSSERFAGISGWFGRLDVHQKLFATIVGWAALMPCASRFNTRITLTVLTIGFVAGAVRPEPMDVMPEVLFDAARDAWRQVDTAGRLGMSSALHLTVYAALGPAHLAPCAVAWLVSAAAVTNPPTPPSYASMDFVEQPARKLVRDQARRASSVIKALF